MPRLLLLLSDEQKTSALVEAAQGLSGWMVDAASDAHELGQMLQAFDWDILALDQDTAEIVAQVKTSHAGKRLESLCTCLLVEVSMLGYEDRLLNLNAHAIIPMAREWCADLGIRYGRLRMMAAAWKTFTQQRTCEQRAMQRQTELAALSQLANVLAQPSTCPVIISRVLQGLIRHGGAGMACAYLEWTLVIPDEPPIPEGLFSESEAEDLESELHASYEPPSHKLTLIDQLSADESLMVCLPPKPHPSWERFLFEHQPTIFERRPAQGVFPGLEPIWYRLKRGSVSLVPVWGGGRPLGILIVAELELWRAQPLWSSAGLEALALMMGNALEHARQVEEATLAYESLQAAQDKLVHAEKFAAVGHLAAQIAHEINNPSSFVISNLSVMRDYAHEISAFEQAIEQAVLAKYPEFGAEVDKFRQLHDVDYVLEDLDHLVEQSLSGMNRIRHIVQELRYFAHDSGPELGWVDVERLLEASLALVRHEIKYRAKVEMGFAACGPVYSDANKLSQVFLNLFVNASQALEHGDPERDTIRVGTIAHEEYIIVFVEDTGVGMSKNVMQRIFEPFFTTKERGQGTGLGLSISRDIVRSLGGDIRVFSEVGVGSRFELLIPRKDKPHPTLELPKVEGPAS